jgi:hypothetical protein
VSVSVEVKRTADTRSTGSLMFQKI